jgi:hypothetical protein
LRPSAAPRQRILPPADAIYKTNFNSLLDDRAQTCKASPCETISSA